MESEEWGRFVNADVYVSKGQGMTGANMFAYCSNDPVNSSDALWKPQNDKTYNEKVFGEKLRTQLVEHVIKST